MSSGSDSIAYHSEGQLKQPHRLIEGLRGLLLMPRLLGGGEPGNKGLMKDEKLA